MTAQTRGSWEIFVRVWLPEGHGRKEVSLVLPEALGEKKIAMKYFWYVTYALTD